MNGIVEMILHSLVATKAKELGLKENRPQDMKPGYYMDLNGQLAIITRMKIIKDDEKGIGIDFDAQTYRVEGRLEIETAANEHGAVFWEYLGPL